MAAPRGYSRSQIILHWTIAALIVFQLLVNADMQRAFAERLLSGALPPDRGAIVHVIVGMLVLVLACIRLGIRLVRGAPDAPAESSALVKALSLATHWLLYGFIFAMPLTGALAWFAGIELAAVLHELGRLVLIPAILLHIAGALVEELVFRNPVLHRMTKPER